MPDLISLYSITFAILVFLTSKYSDYMDKTYNKIASNKKIILEGKVTDLTIYGAFLSRLMGSLILILGFLLNFYLLYLELPKNTFNTPLILLFGIIGFMILVIFFRRLLQIGLLISILKSQRLRKSFLPVVIDIDVEEIEDRWS